MKRLIGLMVVTVSLPLLVSAQDARESWDNLKRLQPGQKIEVVDIDLKTLRGVFASFSEEAISLQSDKGETMVERGNVIRVSARGGKRGRNALIGLGIGAAAGAAGMVIALEKTTNGPVYYDGEAATVITSGAILAGGIGAGIGAAFPGSRTVYRAPKRENTRETH